MTDSVTDQIKARLVPELEALIRRLSERDEPLSVAFFSRLLIQLRAASEEADVIAFAIELSTCAFAGLDYSTQSAQEVDDFLASAESIAHAMTAGDDKRH